MTTLFLFISVAKYRTGFHACPILNNYAELSIFSITNGDAIEI
jgi:hypothetical protein